MNVLEARVVLRDRTFLDVVDLTVRFCVRYGAAYARLAAIVLPPAYLVTWGVATVSGWEWGWTVAILLSPFVAAPFTALASRLLFEPKAPVYEVLASTMTAMPRLVAVRLLEALAIIVTGSCFLVPAMWVLALSFYVNEVFVLERAHLAPGIARAQRLLSGQSGDAIMGLLFLSALHLTAVLLGDLVGRSVLEDLLEITAPPSIFQAKGSVIALGAFWGFVPFEATCRFLLYINARTRTEGWDVQTRFAAIVARAKNEGADGERASLLPGRAA
ncbi:MAG: hypothetical protein ACLQVI_36605 [Polyangiaceae bacterium]